MESMEATIEATTAPQDLAQQLGISIDNVIAWADQADAITGDALTDRGDLTPEGVEAVREQTATIRPTLVIACDMEHDLHMADQLPDVDDDFVGDYDAYDAAVAKIVGRLGAEWVAHAERIGKEWGWHVDAVITKDASYPKTFTEDPSGDGDSIERQIWQAAHDATPEPA